MKEGEGIFPFVLSFSMCIALSIHVHIHFFMFNVQRSVYFAIVEKEGKKESRGKRSKRDGMYTAPSSASIG